MKHPIGERFFVVVGWIAISPFILAEILVMGYEWLIKKIKRK